MDQMILIASVAVLGVGLAALALARWRSGRLALEAYGDRSSRDDALRAIVEAADEGGELEDDSIGMIEGVFELGQTRAREVMVPRMDIVGIPMEASLDEALVTIIRCGHSRIPVYRESIDQIEGVLYAKDLLRFYRDHDFDVHIASVMRQPHFVPESKPLDDLLAELQASRVHLAIVVDEHGGTAGLVTIEDLIEEIVGEIHDEFDADEPDVISVDEGRGEGVFRAGVDIDDVNRLLGIHLPADEDVDTVGGLVYNRLGRVPRQGETAAFDSADIEVLAVEGRRIRRVRVTAHRTVDTDDGAPTSRQRTRTADMSLNVPAKAPAELSTDSNVDPSSSQRG